MRVPPTVRVRSMWCMSSPSKPSRNSSRWIARWSFSVATPPQPKPCVPFSKSTFPSMLPTAACSASFAPQLKWWAISPTPNTSVCLPPKVPSSQSPINWKSKNCTLTAPSSDKPVPCGFPSSRTTNSTNPVPTILSRTPSPNSCHKTPSSTPSSLAAPIIPCCSRK